MFLPRWGAEISANDSAARFKKLGVDVFIGQGCFTASDCIEVGEKSLRFGKAVIATGARAASPVASDSRGLPTSVSNGAFAATPWCEDWAVRCCES